MSPSDDLCSVLTEDHHELRQLLYELDHLTAPEPLWRSLVDLLIAEMIRHSIAEEAYLYPVARDRLPEGPRLLEPYMDEHETIEALGKRLESHDLPSAELTSLLAQLRRDVCAHMRSEEQKLFPPLAEHLGADELSALGRKAAEVKAKASVRQRSSDRPLLNTLIETGTGLVERVRTYVRGRAYPI
ncbi:hemerythrin domain-containing protein [Actinoallomurus rhizosphaericola]|uniref:hemerythrin domain-containing protein n=1 Tax=Actinoallomurus rhizosphaericola TaxID=2952536 RepID=UPI002092AD9E|nr:hemerythrin domain-containing protein [Actinoallomurus rhizosphaericola]MCO5997851.1 hemerythrin domain-containing protein [Actinoallomurus rhizosphaericola]